MSLSGYTLTVRWRGVFAFALPNQEGKPVEVYAPSCGHVYGFCLDETDDPMSLDPRKLIQLNPKSHVLELSLDGSTPSALKGPPNDNLIRTNRTVKNGWDLRITVPLPSSIDSDNKIPLNGGVFEGRDGVEIMTRGYVYLDQVFTYEGVVVFDLCGSKLGRQTLDKDRKLLVAAEIPYQPTVEHQRGAVDALAEVLGLDMRLAEPFGSMPSSIENMSGNCMGGAYGGNP